MPGGAGPERQGSLNASSGLVNRRWNGTEERQVTIAPTLLPAHPDAGDYEAAARSLLPDGDMAQALALAQQGERLALARGEDATAAWCQLHQALALAELGDARALSVARAAVRGFMAAGCPVGAARAHAAVAQRLTAAGADGVVEELAHAAVALDAVTSPSLDLAQANGDLGVAELAIGLLDRAHAHARRAVAIGGEVDASETDRLRALATLGEVVRQQVEHARRSGDDAAVRALAGDWLAGWPRLEPRGRRCPALWPRLAIVAAWLLVEVGADVVRAIALLEDARQASQDQPDAELLALACLARVNLRTGHLAAAHGLLDAGERLALTRRVHGALVGLAETRAAVHEAAGDAPAALVAFKRFHQLSAAETDHHRRRQADAVRARVAELVQHSMMSALAEMANTDALTGLRNRRFLDSEAPALVDARRATGANVSVAVIDVDKFKQVNDHYGHPTGDAVLTAIGNLLRAGVRDGDVVVRTGGDEFVLLLFGATLDQAHRVLDRVRDSVARADWSDIELPAVTMTIGAVQLRHSQRLDEAIADADNELLSAKRAGRNTVHSAAGRPAAA